MPDVSVLIPTCNRPDALAVTLNGLYYQDFGNFEVIVADQSDMPCDESRTPMVAVSRMLRKRGVDFSIHPNLPRRGMAQQRQFLLDKADSRYSLFLDDDVILERNLISMLVSVLERQACGFAGCAVIGLSYLDDVRPHEQVIEFFRGPVTPERVTPGAAAWSRHRLHNAANVWHVQQHYGARPEQPLLYKVSWVGGCVLYDTGKLRDSGGFEFWRDLPVRHCGEDVLAQLRVAERFGGCGVLPSGAYHQELKTTVQDRRINAPEYLEI